MLTAAPICHAIRRQRGLSLVELLVGVALGLFIVAGAVTLAVSHLRDARRQVLESKVNQELRAAADLIARDIRRAGYWHNATKGVWQGAGSTAMTSNYSPVTASSDSLVFSYARDDNDALDGNEQFRIERVVDSASGRGVLRFNNGSGLQPITDVNTVNITSFDPDDSMGMADTERLCLVKYCPNSTVTTCPAGAANTYPALHVRTYTIRIAAESAVDSNVKREIVETVRLRNDLLVNVNGCPA